MSLRMRALSWASLILGFVLLRTSIAQDPFGPARYVPDDIPLYVEIHNPRSVVGDWQASPLYLILDALGTFENMDADQRRFAKFLETIAPLLGENVGIGLRFETKPPRVLVVADDPGSSFEKFEAALHELSPQWPKGKPDRVLGNPAIDFGDLGAIVKKDRMLIYASGGFLLRRALGLAEGSSIGNATRYADAAARYGTRQAFFVGDLKSVFAANEGLANPDNFLAPLLFRGTIDALLSARSVAGGLDLGAAPKFEFTVDGSAAAENPWARTEKVVRPTIENAGIAAWMHVDRDVAGFWNARLAVIPESGRQSIVEFTRTLSIFFSGFSLDQVMKPLDRGFDVVVAPPAAPSGHDPDVVVPEFALVFHGKIAPELADRWRAGFQTAIGVVNTGGAESARQPFLQSTIIADGHEMIVARYLHDVADDYRRTEYNFSPTLAVTPTEIVLASGSAIARTALEIAPTLRNARGDQAHVRLDRVADLLSRDIDYFVDKRTLSGDTNRRATRTKLAGVFERIRGMGSLVLEHEDDGPRSTWSIGITPANSDQKK